MQRKESEGSYMKIGMIFEGGACRSAFSAGVMDAFLDENIQGDYLIGVSAGACYMASYASGQRGRNKELVVRYIPDRRYMGPKYLSKRRNHSYFNLDFIYDQIPNYYLPFDYRAFAAFPGEVIAVVTNMETGKPEYLPIPRKDRRSTLLRATCALPLMFPPIEYCGKLYMDGGITDPIPVAHTLEEAGCDKAVVVLTQDRRYIKAPEKALEIGKLRYRDYPAFVKALDERTMRYNGALARVRKYEEEGRAFVIAPRDSSGYHRLEQDPKVLEQWYDDGYQAAMDSMDALRAFLREDGKNETAAENMAD